MPRIQINLTSVLVHNNRKHNSFKYKETIKDLVAKCEPGSHRPPVFKEASLNHKFYRFKKKDYSAHCCESFALPDEPIYPEALVMFKGREKSNLDVLLPNPQDLCCVNLNHIDEPWLIESHEVITPYWDPNSLFSFNPEDIRCKAQLEEIDTLNDYVEVVDNSATITPPSGQTTISIQNSELSGIDIAELKDHVLKAIEEVIKTSSKVDMKIQIVANSNDANSIEVRVNEGKITTPLERREACADTTKNIDSLKRATQTVTGLGQGNKNNLKSQIVANSNVANCFKERGIETKLASPALHARKRSTVIKKSISINHQQHIQESDTPDTTLGISTISVSSEDSVNVGNAQSIKEVLQSNDKLNGNISKKRKRTTDMLGLSISPIPNVTPKIRHTHQKSKYYVVPCHNENTNESKLPKTLREKTEKSKPKPSSIVPEQDISANIDDTQSPSQRRTRRKRDFSYLKYQSKRVLRSSMKITSSGEESQSTAKDCLNISEPVLQNRTVCDELPRLVRGDLEETLDYDEKCLQISNIANSQAPVLSMEIKQDDCPILPLIVDFPHETSLSDEKDSITPIRKSKRVFKPVDKLDMLELERKFAPIKKEVVQVVPDCKEELDDAPLLTRLQYATYGDIADKVSEVGSKSSGSDMTSSSLYSFEYQVELHKQNNLFHRLKNVRVCDHCFRQGDLQKCKGKCGGSFHTNCLSNVGSQPRRVSLPTRTKFAGSKQKSKVKPEMEKPETEPRILRRCRTRSQCEIITVRSKYIVDPPRKDSLPGNFNNLSIADQIDYGMQEMMRQSEHCSAYVDLSDTSSDVEYVSQTRGDLDVSENSENLSGINVAHVTADSIILTEEEDQPSALKCTHCRLTQEPPCFSCGLEINKRGESSRRKCSLFRCGRYYHTHCLKAWPQTRWSIGKWSKIQLLEDDFTCPAHRCHTCFSEELGSSASCRLPGDKLARCLLCPSAFHATTFCTPAGSEILSGSQIICPKHRSRKVQAINTGWCFICSEGGNLVCCDTCPTSVHPECQPVNFTDDDKYVCEDCESGRFPLYDEVVWVKLGQYRWWPALILFPNEVPLNVRLLKHQRGDFVVRFFGTNDHYWVNKARSFLFQEGDNDGGPSKPCKSRNKVYQSYAKAIQDAEIAYRLKKEFKLRQEADSVDTLKPPAYIRINKNKPVGNVKYGEFDLSNATACECNPQKPRPCGVDSNCINRLLMTECDPNICRAGIRCRNQAFQRREYSSVAPYKTQGRGWGLKALSSIKHGRFIIEYVGELIDSEEYQRRIRKMHEKKEDNYYFMTVDSDRVIDAGPKGNLSRFMNHSCDPNCVTQKWTVLGETRVGLFANCDIDAGSELTFNYNFEVVGQEKKVCKCGAKTCSGFIGGKVKLDKLRDSSDAALVPKKRRSVQKQSKNSAPIDVWVPPCFVCGGADSNISCTSNLCQKSYHLRCVELDHMPKGGKYTCPRHNCKMCFHRTNRCCVLCLNSYCAYHANGHVRYDRQLGFVCYVHDPLNEVKTHPKTRSAHRKAQEVPGSPKSDEDVSEDDLSLMERLERSRRK